MTPGPIPPPAPGTFDNLPEPTPILVVEVAVSEEESLVRWAVVVREVDGPEIAATTGRVASGTVAEAALVAVRYGLDVVAETNPTARVSVRGDVDAVGRLVVTSDLPHGAAAALLGTAGK